MNPGQQPEPAAVTPAEAAEPGIALGEARPGTGVHRFAHAAMATVFEVHCAHDDLGYARQAAHAAFELVDRLEQDLSRFRANSDVSRINELKAGQSTRVSPWTLECLEIARRVYDLTGAAFDVSIGSGLESLELVAGEFTVHARANGVRLDLGGIGKGYAVDRMAELLGEWGVDQALVHGGFSSVLALEPPPDQEGWALTLSSPWTREGRVLALVSARQMALSASGTRKGDHIVDPSTGRAVRGRAAWAALMLTARSDQATNPALHSQGSPAALAEGFSTAFMILPTRDIEAICRQCPGLETWLALEPAASDGREALLHVPSAAERRDLKPE